MRFAVVLACVLAAACGSPNRPAPPPTGPTPPPGAGDVSPAAPGALVDPGMRLPRDVAISRYGLALVLDPAKPTMTGTITIHGELTRTVDTLWLHGEQLTIAKATAERRGQGGGAVQLAVVPGAPEGKLALRAPAPLVAGPIVLTIAYTAVLAETETAGTFRQKVGEDWYAFTQHEAISARRSFPCLDEPDLKVPWEVSITAPAALLAVGNAPETSAKVDGAMKTTTFAPTEAIPSYLVAYAVGPFDVVDAGKSKSGTPHRILTLRGRASEAAYAAALMPRVTDELERWFDMPHPFAKLDSITIPSTVGFGAMENPGLITYQESLLLLPPDASTLRKSRLMSLAAHEIAHQWFGNLVTMKWWDDLWLNESFASWLPEKVIGALEPGWRRPEDAVGAREEALGLDALATARRVRQPIVGDGDIVTAFDRITYAKGSAVLRLFEARLGPERFQAGVRAYIRKHARGNATAADFLAAIDAAAPDSGASAAMATLIDQAGAPRLRAAIECPAGGQPGVRLKQERFVPPGAAAAEPARWKLPVCVRAGGAGREQAEEVCTSLDAAEAFVPLARCPTWVWPNAGGLGYWRTSLDRAGWVALRTTGWKKLGAADRVSLANDLFAAVGVGEVDVTLALELVPLLVAEDNRAAMATAAGLIERIDPWVPAAQRKRFAAWIRTHLGRRAAALGWLPSPRDDLQRESMRARVVALVAILGAEPSLNRAAVKLARDWRKLPDAARGDVLVAAVLAEPAVADTLLADFRTEPSRSRRADLARALGSVRDPNRLNAALTMLLEPAFDIRDTMPILHQATNHDDTRPAAHAFAALHLPTLVSRLEGETAGQLISVLLSGCDPAITEAHLPLVNTHLAHLRGSPRRISQSTERISQCAARKEKLAPAITAWLQKR